MPHMPHTGMKILHVKTKPQAEMGEDFQELVQQVADCLTELDEVKADLAGFGVCEATVE